MTPAQKQEFLRRQFAKEAVEGDFESNFVKEIVIVAKEMGGWKIEYILDMPIMRYTEVRRSLKELYEEQNKAMKQDDRKLTFR